MCRKSYRASAACCLRLAVTRPANYVRPPGDEAGAPAASWNRGRRWRLAWGWLWQDRALTRDRPSTRQVLLCTRGTMESRALVASGLRLAVISLAYYERPSWHEAGAPAASWNWKCWYCNLQMRQVYLVRWESEKHFVTATTVRFTIKGNMKMKLLVTA